METVFLADCAELLAKLHKQIIIMGFFLTA